MIQNFNKIPADNFVKNKRVNNSFKIYFVYHFNNDEEINFDKIDFFQSQPKGIVNSLDGYILGFYGRIAILDGMQNEVISFINDKLIPIELNIASNINAKDVYYDFEKIENSNFVDFTNLTDKVKREIINILNIQNKIEEYSGNFNNFLTYNVEYIFEIIDKISIFKNIKIFNYQNILNNGKFIKVFALPLNFASPEETNIIVTDCIVDFVNEEEKNYSLLNKLNKFN